MNNHAIHSTTRVAVCQVPDIREDIETSLKWIQKYTRQAEVYGASLVCFPECFMQGYLTQKDLVAKYAINLNSPAFKTMLKELAHHKPMIVFGLIEEEEQCLFNTAAVIRNGELIGKYRKTNLLDGERIFKAGSEYPVFNINDLKFGINICYDTQFPEAAARLVAQGAKLILCPANNMMTHKTAEKYKHLHHNIRIKRVIENRVWLMSADITGSREGRIAYGPTSAINPDGKVVAQVPLMKTGMVIVDI